MQKMQKKQENQTKKQIRTNNRTTRTTNSKTSKQASTRTKRTKKKNIENNIYDKNNKKPIMKCKATTNKGEKCKRTASNNEGYCQLHDKNNKAGTGRKKLPVTKEEFYNKILEYHVIAGQSITNTAKLIGVVKSTVYAHMEDFRQWLREETNFDQTPTTLINKYLARSEDRRTQAYMENMNGNLSTNDRIKLLKEMRDEDGFQVKILQDVGLIEKRADNLQVINNISASDFFEAYQQTKR